ncbi:STAS domain-containing protein [Actinoplanes sp. NEAU-A12]|uniref:Anti-sigma factor antagonist n=1 Tax=Actinoplanes sandaracinus TaxID=3045177 RepID=A0ABT6WMD1_9ACTN|nr:STAS domain-containing protein [Actinoplanes sandaracinus]MDI6100897.1 STAS domain-containing protein [Actinoplanes sandaracinus]
MMITRLDDGGVTRLMLRGELDMATGDDLGQQVARVLADRPEHLIVDLAGLTFCDSSGIDVLLAARESAGRAGIGFQVARPRGIVHRSLSVTGVLDVLTAEPAPVSDREAAGGRP